MVIQRRLSIFRQRANDPWPFAVMLIDSFALHKEKYARGHIMKVLIALILIGIADIFALLLCAYIAFRFAAEEQKRNEKEND